MAMKTGKSWFSLPRAELIQAPTLEKLSKANPYLHDVLGRIVGIGFVRQ
ncbi:MAG: hypothetical protein M2R45_05210 [Verrucomicrobia subdivision 3 bacterium]|nr:hypothetical protein [Limisphaerales bacterium]MCS1413886.1 hypothetical protein [Limisphaerales bacterium]